MTLSPHLKKTLSHFPESLQLKLSEQMASGGMVPASLVRLMMEEMEVSLEQVMVDLLPLAASFARPPISNFFVGAIALGMPSEEDDGEVGNLYFGANMEFPGEALSFSVHGEQSAITNAWLHGESGVQALAINAAPCGYCRQFLNELLTAKSFKIILRGEGAEFSSRFLSYFLPSAFGPTDLGIEGGLMQAEHHELNLDSNELLVSKALDAAKASYAPYSKVYSGVALKTNSGEIYVGRYAENAAYSPSMSPLQSALANMNMNRPAQEEIGIEAAALVENSGPISQLSATAAVLSSIAPNVTLDYFSACF